MDKSRFNHRANNKKFLTLVVTFQKISTRSCNISITYSLLPLPCKFYVKVNGVFKNIKANTTNTKIFGYTTKYLSLLFIPESPCTTPSGGAGKCISICNCTELTIMMNKQGKSQEDIDYLQRSFCGQKNGEPQVSRMTIGKPG